MKFPGGLNIQSMMKQAQQMQEKMAREMEELRVEASAGGGVVSVQMKGDHEIISLKVDPEVVKENDVEMLQDMIVAAVNEGNRKVNEAMKSKILCASIRPVSSSFRTHRQIRKHDKAPSTKIKVQKPPCLIMQSRSRD